MRTPESPKTLYDKIFDEHVVRMEEDGTATLYIDRHLVHEVTSAQAFEGLRMNNRPLWRKSSIVATADHITEKETAQNVPAPVTTYALFRDGKFVTQSIQSDKKFLKLAAE